jgi:hypothetical protein
MVFSVQSATEAAICHLETSSPRETEPPQDRTTGKAVLETFVHSSQTVHVEFIPEGATVKKHRFSGAT